MAKKKSSDFTTAQRAAYNAGIGYAVAKQGKRVPVKDENKSSFRAGFKKGKSLK